MTLTIIIFLYVSISHSFNLIKIFSRDQARKHHEKNTSLFVDTLSHYQKIYYNELKILTDNFHEEPFETVDVKDYDIIFTLGNYK